MLCCIIFLVTSLNTKAAEGDIVFTNSSSTWRTSCSDSSSVGSDFKGYYTVTWEFSMSGNSYRSYNKPNIELNISNAYIPIGGVYNTSLGVNFSTFSFDSNSGVFLNGNRVGFFSFPNTSDFSMSSTGVDGNNSVTHDNYYFAYMRNVSVVVPMSSAQYLSEGDVYIFRPSFTVFADSMSYALIGISSSSGVFNHGSPKRTWDNVSNFPLATCYFKETSSSVSSSVSTSDTGTQNAINNQTNTIQEGNDIAQEGNDIAEDTNNKITSFFSSFFDNLIGVFVPESGFFSQWFSDLNTFMSQKLGFLWTPFDFIITFLNGVYSGSGSSSITFPELAWIDGTVIIPQTQFSFDNFGGQSFIELRDMIYFATDVILLGAVVSQFYQKLKLVFEGGS